MRELFGLINAMKPRGITSRKLVDRVEQLVWPARVGHTGTLDPIASGVLVVCIGRATRLTPYVQRMPKTYRATFQLGCASASDDIEEPVTLVEGAPVPTADQIERAARGMTGSVVQVPPVFSAAKVHGRRAYSLARRGEPVELSPRTVRIDSLRVTGYRYPELKLEVVCGSGTYLRSVGRDLARSLGTSAVMSGLERSAVGPFSLTDACDVESLSTESVAAVILPAALAVEELPRMTLSGERLERLLLGQTVETPGAPPASDDIAVVDAGGRLMAIVRAVPGGRLKPIRTFPPECLPIGHVRQK